ncbi:MAG: energy transducer TonB [Steroidobacteraceae bacterium]|nr:energy transducer TonB [Steroidobacteraceae bacterium]
MLSTARAATLAFVLVPGLAFAQAGPADPQIIVAAPTAKVNIGNRKLAGQVVATVRVDDEGKARDVLVTEITADPVFEAPIVKVLQSTRFRPAIDEAGKPIEASIEVKVELRPSTGTEPKPSAAKPDPQLTEKEKARIRRMTCADFNWEWEIIRDAADDAAATEFMPRIATTMYAASRTEAGEYVDAKVWKAAPRAFRDSADRCEDTPQAAFWQDTFKSVMDVAVPK